MVSQLVSLCLAVIAVAISVQAQVFTTPDSYNKMKAALSSYVSAQTARQSLELSKAQSKVATVINTTSTNIMAKRGSLYQADGKTVINGSGYAGLSSKPVSATAPKCLGNQHCTVTGFNETKGKALENTDITSSLKYTHPLDLRGSAVF